MINVGHPKLHILVSPGKIEKIREGQQDMRGSSDGKHGDTMGHHSQFNKTQEYPRALPEQVQNDGDASLLKAG